MKKQHFNPLLKLPFLKKEVFLMSHPVIDYEKCKSHFVCIQVCPMNVFVKEDNKSVVKNPSACIDCKACEVQCPEQAIKVVED